MTLTIWKYNLGLTTNIQPFDIPIGAKFCYSGPDPDDNLPALWFLVDLDAKTEQRVFQVYATGQQIADQQLYLGSARQGAFMWHVFEVLP